MEEGFQKINLTEPTAVESLSYKRQNTPKKFNVFGMIIAAFIIVFVIFIIAIIIPGKDVYSSLRKTELIGREAFQAIKNQDLELSSKKLKETENDLIDVKSKLSKLAWLKYIPLIGVYESDAEHLIQAALAGIQAGEITTSTIVPYSDLLGLKGKSTFVAGSADDRIRTAVETLDKVTPKIEEISQKIAIVGKELDQVDSTRYPESIGSIHLQSRLKQAKDIFAQTAKLFIEAQPLLRKLPDLLGNKSSRTYLVLFQNDKELRATGGFITGYALFKVEKGKMQVVKADDIYKLDESKNKKYPAPDPIIKYHKNVTSFELRDSNISPDFTVSMKEFEKMLSDSVPDFPKFDGIVTVDTHVLVSAIKILGDFNVYGRVFSSETDKRCDCPKAIYELEDYSTRPVAYVRDSRKDIIAVLLYQIMQRSLGISPSKYWGKLFQMFLNEASEKHVLFYFHDPDAQKGIEAINYGGRITSTDSDYLHINDVNFAGAKSNLFVKESVTQDISIDNSGTARKTITIRYKNPNPPSNCNLEAGQLCLNGILRNWLRIYVPSGSKLVEFTGSEKDSVSYEEFGKTVFEGFLTVKPQGASEVKVVYTLPLKVKKGDVYSLLIQKQAGTDGNEYTVSYNGRQIDAFPLIIDKNISFKL